MKLLDWFNIDMKGVFLKTFSKVFSKLPRCIRKGIAWGLPELFHETFPDVFPFFETLVVPRYLFINSLLKVLKMAIYL